MPPVLSAPLAAPQTRIAHLVRPAEGGMRAQVRSLLSAFPHGLLAASPETCAFCADVVSSDNCFFSFARQTP